MLLERRRPSEAMSFQTNRNFVANRGRRRDSDLNQVNSCSVRSRDDGFHWCIHATHLEEEGTGVGVRDSEAGRSERNHVVALCRFAYAMVAPDRGDTIGVCDRDERLSGVQILSAEEFRSCRKHGGPHWFRCACGCI